jgi:hypothetical protein
MTSEIKTTEPFVGMKVEYFIPTICNNCNSECLHKRVWFSKDDLLPMIACTGLYIYGVDLKKLNNNENKK